MSTSTPYSAPYISWIGHGAASLAAPAAFTGVNAYVFGFAADRDAMQRLTDTLLNVASDDTVHYDAMVGQSLITFMDIARCTSTVDAIGWLPGRECALWVPLLETSTQHLLPRVVFWAPYIFIDYSIGMLTGREIWGWPKVGARIAMPWDTPAARAAAGAMTTSASATATTPAASAASTMTASASVDATVPATPAVSATSSAPAVPATFSCTTTVFATLDPNTRGSDVPLLTLNSSGPLAAPTAAWPDGSVAGRDIASKLLGGIGGIADSLIDALSLQPVLPAVAMKQVRDSLHGERACFQGIVDSPARVTRFSGGGLLNASDFTLSVATCESHAIVADLLGRVADPGATDIAIEWAAHFAFDFEALPSATLALAPTSNGS